MTVRIRALGWNDVVLAMEEENNIRREQKRRRLLIYKEEEAIVERFGAKYCEIMGEEAMQRHVNLYEWNGSG